MSLAGNDKNVAGAKVFQRGGNGLAPASDVLRTWLVACGNACHDGGAYTGGIFAARIVVGHDNIIRMTGGNGTHLRALAHVAISAAAENDMQLAMTVWPHGVQHGFKAIRRMGVINIDSGTVWQCGRQFQAAAHALQSFHCCDGFDTQAKIIGVIGNHQCKSHQRIHGLKITGQR